MTFWKLFGQILSVLYGVWIFYTISKGTAEHKKIVACVIRTKTNFLTELQIYMHTKYYSLYGVI